MKIKLFFPIFFLFLLLDTSSIHAAIIHLNSGGSLSGRVQSMDDQTLALESDRGFGVLQIDRADIRMIEFDGNLRNLKNKFGFGYYSRAAIADEVNISAATMKFWLTSTNALEFQLGFGSTSDGGSKVQETFSLGGVLTSVLLQEGNQDIYWGFGLSAINAKDTEKNLDDTGFGLKALVGIEFFFTTIPNLGISAELGVMNQSIGSRRTYGIFNSGFPTMAVRYYF